MPEDKSKAQSNESSLPTSKIERKDRKSIKSWCAPISVVLIGLGILISGLEVLKHNSATYQVLGVFILLIGITWVLTRTIFEEIAKHFNPLVIFIFVWGVGFILILQLMRGEGNFGQFSYIDAIVPIFISLVGQHFILYG